MSTTHCDAYAEAIGDLIDDTIDPSTRQALEAHLVSCPACRLLVADLQHIRETAGTLERHGPPAAAWDGIETRLSAEGAGARRSRLAHPAWLAFAAALVLGIGLSVWWLGGVERRSQTRVAARTTPVGDSGADSAAGNARSADLVESIEHELRMAEAHYTKAIAGLEQAAKAQQGVLDPATAATLRENLAVLDNAIADARGALRGEPDSRLAQESLFEALRRKVALLQDTVALGLPDAMKKS